MIYLELFFAYLQIGAFSIGGGHASIPVAQSVIVDTYGWMNMQEFTDMITLSEMTPGPFAINSATFVGIKTGGVLGGVIATLAFLIPSILVCFSFYAIVKKFRKVRAIDGLMQGVKPAVTGLISSAGLTILLSAIFGVSTLSGFLSGAKVDFVALIIAGVSFAVVRKTKLNPVIVILLSGIVGAVVYTFL